MGVTVHAAVCLKIESKSRLRAALSCWAAWLSEREGRGGAVEVFEGDPGLEEALSVIEGFELFVKGIHSIDSDSVGAGGLSHR